MKQQLTTVAFDADDTLWHNERFFKLTQDRFADLLRDYTEADHLHARLVEAERRNLGHYGFGIKGFMLSMIETAIEVTQERVPASVIAELIAAGQDMLRHPVDLLPHARDAIETVSRTHRILLITKGDLLDQERKLAQSGLGDLFDGVEIVSHKTPETYSEIFDRYCGGGVHAMMIGNSLRSDVRPVVEIGGWGVHVPHDLTWALEHDESPDDAPRYRVLPDLAGVASLVAEIG
jgi:putative hydrolase of the HAD superfamily